MDEKLEVEVISSEVSVDEFMGTVKKKFPRVHFGKLQIHVNENAVMVEEVASAMNGHYTRKDSLEDKESGMKQISISVFNFTLENLTKAVNSNFPDAASWKNIIISVGKWAEKKSGIRKNENSETKVLILRNWISAS